MDRTDQAPPLPIVAPEGPASTYVGTVLDGWSDDIEVRAPHAGRRSRPQFDLLPFDVPDDPTEVWRRSGV